MNEYKQEWISLVKQGQLDKGYTSYLTQNPFHAFTRKFPLRVFSALLSLLLAYRMKRSRPALNLNDDAVDLSEEFVVFWKCPDVIGRMLLKKILFSYLRERKIPARALGWYGHWLVFQGRYNQAAFFFKYLLSRVVKDSRLHGEILSLSGNYFYSRNNFDESIIHHQKADKILKANNDKFFQMFNLGTSAKTYTEQGNLEFFKTSVLAGFDHLNPMEPDERYGMRVLIYYAYLNFIHDNLELGKQFYVSAERCYSKSGSSLDKAIYCAYKAIILIFFRDLDGARVSIRLARTYLAEFGTYRSHEKLISSIDRHLHKGNISHPLIENLLGIENKARRSELESWYRNFFTTILPAFENFQSHPIEQFVIPFETVSGSQIKIELAGQDARHEDIKNAQFDVFNNEDGTTTFSMELFHQDKLYHLNLKTSFKRWRNTEIFDSIRSTLYLLHSLSKQDQLKSITYFQDQKLKNAETARRIAHDIKSPLAALQVTLNNMTLQNRDLSIIRASTQKIEDIVHGLGRGQGAGRANEVKKIFVKSFIDSLLADKRIEYQEKNITFNLSYLNNSSSKYIEVNELEMNRSLSNIINNAVESYEDRGSVDITVNASIGSLEILIRDFGCGIESTHIDKIFQKDISFKSRGSGLGLYYAKSFLDENNGKINVFSKVSMGTTFTISFPLCTPPGWIKTTLFLKDYSRIIIADDFVPNVEMIRKKILKHCPESEILSFTSLKELEMFVDNNDCSDSFFIIDYDFGSCVQNGLDFITGRKLSSRSVLATHHFEDVQLVATVSEAGVKIIPKIIFDQIEIVRGRPHVLIADDEKYFLRAIRNKLETKYPITTLEEADEILEHASSLEEECFYFIDRNFSSSGLRGEDIIAGLKKLGKSNIFNISEERDFYDENSLKISKTEIENFLS